MSGLYNPRDKYFEKAKKEGYRARSVYKLQELDNRYHLFHSGIKVLDIGAAPGSWLQYISLKIGRRGRALGLDTKPIEPVADNVITQICDISETLELNKFLKVLGWGPIDIIVSDIMPNTVGVKQADCYKSVELGWRVFEIAKQWLKPRGFLVMKVFEGEGFDGFIRELKSYFFSIRVAKVKASRPKSREVYLICV